MKENRKRFVASICLLVAFILWTAIVSLIDVQQIGPQGSSVGLAGINLFVHNLTGVHFILYHITDWLGLVPITVCLVFAILGLAQWIHRKDIRKVDFSLFVLGGFYIVTMAVYILFEYVVINYRPVLINGYLEASYPSSTTLLVLCVMPTAALQCRQRIGNRILRNAMIILIAAFMAFMVVGRLLSGVHWLTDIIGGGLLSAGLVMLYHAFIVDRREIV